MTNQQKKCLRMAAKQGRSVNELVEDIGCCKATAHAYVKQFGPKKTKKK